MNKLMTVLACTLMLAVSGFSEEEERPAVKLDPVKGFAVYEFGKIYRGQWQGGRYTDVWRQRLCAAVTTRAHLSERLSLTLDFEMNNWYSFDNKVGDPDGQQRHTAVFIDEAYAWHKFGDPEAPLLELGVGYLPYKYNPQSRNLGEYMFRTGTYPGYIFNHFDFSEVRLYGLQFRNTLGAFRQDLFFYNEKNIVLPPLYDFSLTYMAGYQAGKIFDLGAGVELSRFLPMYPSRTTPRRQANMYVPPLPTDAFGNPDTTASVDTLFYTFKGVKLMGRATFDPKGLFDAGMLGKEDLKIYLEVCVLGVKDYDGPADSVSLYGNILERTPITVGFNLPTFGFLDVLALEFERYAAQYKVDLSVITRDISAKPNYADNAFNPRDPEEFKKDDIKWSIYASREVVPGFHVVLQFASDHLRTPNGTYYPDKGEWMEKKSDWHWDARLKYLF